MDDRAISLPEMLEAREKRAARRQAYFHSAVPGESLLQITVNIPGEVKNSDMIRRIYREAVRAVKELFPDARLLPESSENRRTGPEAYVSLSHTGMLIKKQSCQLEENHLLGRLWDIDVFTDPNHSVSRSEIGFPERRCYICDRPAHECSRSKRHSLDAILEHIRDLFRQFSTEIP